MKNKLFFLCAAAALGWVLPSSVFAVDDNVADNTLDLTITSTAQIAIVTNSTFSMALGGATEAGAAVSATSTNNVSRLRISSLVDNTTRTIQAQIGASIATTNTELWIALSAPNENFANPLNKGTLAAAQNLTSGTAVTVVTGIATCWSGVTDDDGYVINYTFNRKDGATTFTSPGPVTVTFTLSE
jgi:hypothetical protein